MTNLYDLMKYRRTTRKFSPEEVGKQELRNILQAGIYAPSGSNKSPYRIYVIRDQETKKLIRVEAEKVEKEFYKKKREEKASEFLDWTSKKEIKIDKPMLTEAPVLLCVVEDTRHYDKHSKESTWLTIAYLVLAIAKEGLATVTYTPEPHSFMKSILDLPDYMEPQVILPVGYASDKNPRENIRPSLKERVLFIEE